MFEQLFACSWWRVPRGLKLVLLIAVVFAVLCALFAPQKPHGVQFYRSDAGETALEVAK